MASKVTKEIAKSKNKSLTSKKKLTMMNTDEIEIGKIGRSRSMFVYQNSNMATKIQDCGPSVNLVKLGRNRQKVDYKALNTNGKADLSKLTHSTKGKQPKQIGENCLKKANDSTVKDMKNSVTRQSQCKKPMGGNNTKGNVDTCNKDFNNSTVGDGVVVTVHAPMGEFDDDIAEDADVFEESSSEEDGEDDEDLHDH